ncbi:hypothetical protein GGTG_11059 [Gaeumannomyces tritici R3-111a-1]|uniref:Cytochrome b5 heme-binding domain-containing protein n=1 Tax=Gaeumannomyces tritici (strain R3-111a-1) TaxID=644352 RepID=J3PC36_GAET3|nr:hypothetical protein GGTG_11059 [Gaeumannomyces tritici R3-111a-1]EJT71806.1 hypothetical protein GGTG_11059 [Gaeumannomyces tritici R3-111a-1]
MADESELRQRKPPAATWTKIEPGKKDKTAQELADEEDAATNPWLDMLRLAVGLLIAYCGLSYLATGGETFSMGYEVPMKYMQFDWLKSKFQNPTFMTPEQLAGFDGSDEAKPIYLAINGSVFDVSSNRRTYGPGGSYQYFAGVDASRAYVTGCFAEDRTPDLRGVEDMFLPLDDPEVDAHFTEAELAEMRVRELEEARRQVHEALKHWVDFFGKSKKYRYVGRVRRKRGWLAGQPRRELCAPAQKGRSKRKIPEGK